MVQDGEDKTAARMAEHCTRPPVATDDIGRLLRTAFETAAAEPLPESMATLLRELR